MLTVLLLAAALWWGGRWMGVGRGPRLAVLGVLVAFVALAQLVLPEGHPFREMTGGGPQAWAMLLGVVAVVLVYGLVIARLRDRAVARGAEAAAEAAEAAPAGPFSDAELERYSRHIMLRELGGPGQRKLKDAKVLVIGAGGLGSPALLYLGAAGVGTIGVIDDDVVDQSNLQRQVIHRDAAIGTAKVFSAEATLNALNPHVAVRPYNRRLTEEIAGDLFADYDVILDGTDGFDTRYLANRVAAGLGKPLISGALSQWEGQISVFDPARGTPCYQCIFPEAPAPGLAPSCAEAGVLGPLPGVVGSMMAVEAVKVITGAGAALRGELLIYDALWGETRKIVLKRRDDCPVCGLESGAARA
ncbi:ThiF family adenylyltransferase [Pseudooceanicola sp. LIPI14-2-Ac024]|uniref:HesA/MoeB/ThiF family protein n=1 Tax=Pseudooceanicola sp. LIPI14-2-Ac024 TaxID=3344875 RepID=UPI0035D0EEAF